MQVQSVGGGRNGLSSHFAPAPPTDCTWVSEGAFKLSLVSKLFTRKYTLYFSFYLLATHGTRVRMAANTWMSVGFLAMTVVMFVMQGKRQLFRLQVCDIGFCFRFSRMCLSFREHH